jgi:activator of HSP90 ATPase
VLRTTFAVHENIVLNTTYSRVLMRGQSNAESEGTFMIKRVNQDLPVHAPTRRQVIAGAALAVGSLAASSAAWGRTPQMKEAPGNAANQMRTSLHQEVDFRVSSQRIYEVFVDSKQFAACTGMAAEIDPRAGGALSMFGGLVVGRNIELLPNQRIVQAWRPTHWDPGVYSIVKFELKPHASETTIVLDHTGFPEGEFDNLDSGWKLRYWDTLKKYLA